MKRIMLAALAGLAGCSHVVPIFAPTNFDASSMEVIGPAKARVMRYEVLGLRGALEDDLAQPAIEKMLADTHADAIVNIAADYKIRVYLFGIYITRSVTVTGTAVRFKAGSVVRAPQVTEAR